jgi:hypothetical protein
MVIKVMQIFNIFVYLVIQHYFIITVIIENILFFLIFLFFNQGHGTVMKSNASLNEVISRSLPELITRLPVDAFPKYNNNGTMIRAAFEIRTNGDRVEGKQKLIRSAFTIEGAMLHQKIEPKAESWLLQVKLNFEKKEKHHFI